MTSTSIESELMDAMKFANDNCNILADHGFELVSSERQQSQFIADFQMFGYHNKTTGMQTTISFFPKWENQPSNIYPIITDRNGRKLPVEDLLKRRNREDLVVQLTRKADDTDVRGFLHAAYGAVKEIFATELKDIISGKVWETIPFDWAGYR